MRAVLIVAVFLVGVAAGALAYRWQDTPRTPVPAIELRRPTVTTAPQAPPQRQDTDTGDTGGARTQAPAPLPAGRPATPPSPSPSPADDRGDDDDDDDDDDDGDDRDDDD